MVLTGTRKMLSRFRLEEQAKIMSSLSALNSLLGSSNAIDLSADPRSGDRCFEPGHRRERRRERMP
jgi:hypothetical protein